MRLSQVRILAIVCLVCFHHFILYMYRCSERCLFTLLLHTIYTGANCSLPSGVVFYRSLKTIGWPWVAVFISGRRVVSWMCSPFPLQLSQNIKYITGVIQQVYIDHNRLKNKHSNVRIRSPEVNMLRFKTITGKKKHLFLCVISPWSYCINAYSITVSINFIPIYDLYSLVQRFLWKFAGSIDNSP